MNFIQLIRVTFNVHVNMSVEESESQVDISLDTVRKSLLSIPT